METRWTSQLAEDLADKQKNMKMVLEYLKSRGTDGATDQEIQHEMKMAGDSERPARGSLVKLGKVKDSGKWRYTPRKRPAIVWVVVNGQADENEYTEVSA